MQSKIDEILKQRQGAALPAEESVEEADKFFSLLRGEGAEENFFELQFRNGLQTCFSYKDLAWFNHDPESGCIDLDFGGFLVTVKGRGLARIFSGVKAKRIAWVKEADSSMQDHQANDCYVEEISITPPEGSAEEREEAES